MKQLLILIIIIFLPLIVFSQITDVVILNPNEVKRLKSIIKKNEIARNHYQEIYKSANRHLIDHPRQLQKINFEGLLETDPKRVETNLSLKDMDKVVSFIYAYYGSNDLRYAEKAKEYVVAWSNTYIPTGNSINENKLIPLFWAYYLFNEHFLENEKAQVEQWMKKIALAQMNTDKKYNNNWESKRQKIIGIVGCITNSKEMINYSLEGMKKYIETAYYEDGTSNDLRQRDALHYHISGLKPIVEYSINLSTFHLSFNLFDYVTNHNSSVKKSIEYIVPYATGKLERKEWTNSKSDIDKKRAEEGLAQYQPGKLFDPNESVPLFEWAVRYNLEWYSVISDESDTKKKYATSWIGLLNSPLVRKKIN